jgi:hypothetical protein
MLCGHTHQSYIIEPGDERDELGQPCAVIIGSAFNDNDQSDFSNVLAGAYIKLNDHSAEVTVNTKKQIIGTGHVTF